MVFRKLNQGPGIRLRCQAQCLNTDPRLCESLCFVGAFGSIAVAVMVFLALTRPRFDPQAVRNFLQCRYKQEMWELIAAKFSFVSRPLADRIS